MLREGVNYGAGIGPGVYNIHSPRIPWQKKLLTESARCSQFLMPTYFGLTAAVAGELFKGPARAYKTAEEAEAAVAHLH